MTEPLRRRVAYGDGAVMRVPQLVAELGARRVLLVTGKGSFEASGADRVLPELREVAEVRRWSEFRPNTDADDLATGLDVLGDTAPDLVLGIGGGSAMDMAKLLCAYQHLADRDDLVTAIRGGARIEDRGPRLVLVPTTSGSGSEATRFAVVYVGEDKYSIAGPAMLPDAVVLDPTLALTGSPYQRATSGIDAVAQAIESLWASAATTRSRGFARHALRLLLPHIEAFVTSPTAASARAMALGSHLAGRAIDISRTTAAHALSYGITKGFGVSHGHAVALTLGPFLEAHAQAVDASLQPGVDPATHAAVMAELLTRLGATTGNEARRRWKALMERMGLTPSLVDVGVVSAEARSRLASGVNVERLTNNPMSFDTDGLVAILERAA